MARRAPSLGSLLRQAHPERYPSRHLDDHTARAADPIQAEADRLRSSARWQRFRAWSLARHPLCAECLRQGRTVAASTVDHIDRIRALVARGESERAFAEDACQSLCEPCHDAKSARERRGQQGRRA